MSIACPMNSAICYCRFSPKPKIADKRAAGAEAPSIATQEAACRAYATFAQLDIAGVLADEETSGFSTKLRERPNGRALFEQVGKRKVRHVIVHRLDRLFRNMLDGLPILERWQKAGVTLHIVAEGGTVLNTSTAFGWFMVAQRLLFAEFEPRLIAERTSAGMKRRRRAGEAMSSVPTYGTRFETREIVDDNGKRVAKTFEIPDADQQHKISEVLDLVGLGESYNETARIMSRKYSERWDAKKVSRIVAKDAERARA